VIIALYILAACVGLLVGFALWGAVRVHALEQSRSALWQQMDLNVGDQIARSDRVHKRLDRLESLAGAHRRFMRNAVSDASGLGADFMRRLDEHDKRIAKLDRAGHRHGEMEKR
jgi:CHASE1-domain containing sensor protein